MSTGTKKAVLWPAGVTPPLDCDPVGAYDTIARTDILFHSRDMVWRIAEGQHDQTFADLRRDSSRYICVARPRYSRENPPPPPNNHSYLVPEEVAQGDVLAYKAGYGWQVSVLGFSMSTANSHYLAMCKPILSGTIPDPPEGYELVKELDPEDCPSGALFQVLLKGMFWSPYAGWSDAKGAGDRILAKRVVKDEGLPIDILKPGDVMEDGDLVWDRGGKGWFPYIGSKEKVSSALGLQFVGAGRLHPGFRDQTVLRMSHTITEHHQLLVKHGDEWRWSAPETEQIGRVAYMVPEVIALRMNGQSNVKPRSPVGEWMSLHLQNMLLNAPDSDVFRGLVRTSCRMVIPREMHQRGNVDEIRTWLEETRAANFVDDAEVRVYDARQAPVTEDDGLEDEETDNNN